VDLRNIPSLPLAPPPVTMSGYHVLIKEKYLPLVDMTNKYLALILSFRIPLAGEES